MKFLYIIAALSVGVPASLRAQNSDTLHLSLEAAVQRAMATGDEANLANAQVQVADAQVTTARAAALPQLALSGTYSHVYENARANAVGSIFNQPNTYNVNANLSQPLFQGGRVLAGLRASGSTRAAAQLNRAETRAQIAFDMQRAYLDALLAARLLQIQEANLEQSRAQLAQVELFEKSGRASRYEVLRARVQQTNVQPLVIQAGSAREFALLEVKRLANLPMEQPLVLTTVLDTAAVQRVVAAVSASSGTGDRRGSVRAAGELAEAREAAVRVARADLFPSLSLTLRTGYQAFPRENGLPPGFGRLERVECAPGSDPARICTEQNGGFFADRAIGIQVSWPIFDGLRTKGSIDLAQAQQRVARLELAREREAVRLEVASARNALAAAQAVFNAQRQNVGEAQEAFRLANLRFSRGLSTQLEVNDAQIALLTAEINQARAVYDLYLAAAELARALGDPIPLPDGGVVAPALNR